MPDPIKPLEGPIYAISFDELARVYQQAKSLARQVEDELLQQACRGADMAAHYLSYAPSNAEFSGEPPTPPEHFECVSMLSLFEGPEPDRNLIRGKAALVQRSYPHQLDQWIDNIIGQGLQIIEHFPIDLQMPENVSRVCSKLFMLPDERAWDEIEKNKFQLRAIPDDTRRKFAPLIVLSKMDVHLPWLLEGSGAWRRLIEAI